MNERDRSSGRSHWRDDDGRSRGGYRPMTGDYGRSQRPRDDYGRDQDGDDRNRYYGSQWSGGERDRGDDRGTSFVGSRGRSQHHDPHYSEWRKRQLDQYDRDYDEYHRERQSSFENDFGSWRERRQQKRQTLGGIREHMEVVGKDGEHVGAVDKTAGDRIILTRSDPDAGGAHHSISCSDIDRVENDRVLLECTADEAKRRWRNEDRSRALFEREDRGEDGPHMLDRSFSGTYRD